MKPKCLVFLVADPQMNNQVIYQESSLERAVLLADQSDMVAYAPVEPFDETAERAAFEHVMEKEEGFILRYYNSRKYIPEIQCAWMAWLACAKRKAGVL